MSNESLKDTNIAVVSNIILEPYFSQLLKTQFSYININVNLNLVSFAEHNENSYKKTFLNSDIIVVWINFDSLVSNAFNMIYSQEKTERQVINEISNLCKKLYMDLSLCSNAQIIWFLFEDYFSNSYVSMGHKPICNALIDKINIKILNLLNGNISFVDLKNLIAEAGICFSYDLKGNYRWNAPYSNIIIKAAVSEIYKKYMITTGITKKCIILDCDNVLWGGIISERGIEHINLGGSGLGKIYQDFQKFLLSLYYHGVILAICSKNDISDVMIVFREHSEMVLREEHIACFMVNWNDKANNIRQISELLNIGLDSIIFIDDTPFEVESVKDLLPEVNSILYEKDSIYKNFLGLNLKPEINIETIKQRNNAYKTNIERNNLKRQYVHFDKYLEALEMKITIKKAELIEYSRISELSQRTNKRTNGRRYTVSELKEKIKSENYTVYSIHLSDKFSDLGLVGVIGINNNELDLFCLSCRALGRNIENGMIEFLSDKKIKSCYFSSTGKNIEIKELLNIYGEI